MTPPDGVAVCLFCGNEWAVRAPGIQKKRKCPVCGKYRVRLKSELNEGENGEMSGNAGGGTAPPAAGGESCDSVSSSPAVSAKPEEKAEEKKEEKTSGGGLLLLAVGLVVVGVAACSFLFPSGAPRHSPAPAHGERRRRLTAGIPYRY